MSLLEYCLEREERSPSPLLLPPLAGSKVGLAAVVIFQVSSAPSFQVESLQTHNSLTIVYTATAQYQLAN